LAGLPFPPRDWLRGVGVAVTPTPPFTLSAKYELPEAVRGLSAKLVVTATATPASTARSPDAGRAAAERDGRC